MIDGSKLPPLRFPLDVDPSRWESLDDFARDVARARPLPEHVDAVIESTDWEAWARLEAPTDAQD